MPELPHPEAKDPEMAAIWYVYVRVWVSRVYARAG
jgi:hypothetical protein